MATVHTSQAYPAGFSVNNYTTNLSGGDIIFTPPTGTRAVLTNIVISSQAAMTVDVGFGEAASAVESPVLFQVAMAANQTVCIPLDPPVAGPVDKEVVADSSGAGNISVFVQGYVV